MLDIVRKCSRHTQGPVPRNNDSKRNRTVPWQLQIIFGTEFRADNRSVKTHGACGFDSQRIGEVTERTGPELESFLLFKKCDLPRCIQHKMPGSFIDCKLHVFVYCVLIFRPDYRRKPPIDPGNNFPGHFFYNPPG